MIDHVGEPCSETEAGLARLSPLARSWEGHWKYE